MHEQPQLLMDRCLKRSAVQRGVGIVEVLVALVVVSFGVLGMASLQLTGMKHSTGGFNRAKALMYAENIASRMRINESGVENAFYGNFDTENGGFSCAALPAKLCQASPGSENPASCNAQELAAFDLFTIACGDIDNNGQPVDGVKDALFGGQVQVNCDSRTPAVGGVCDTDSTHTITIAWQEGSVSSDDKTAVVNRRVQVRLQP